jgi:hypothetical protein
VLAWGLRLAAEMGNLWAPKSNATDVTASRREDSARGFLITIGEVSERVRPGMMPRAVSRADSFHFLLPCFSGEMKRAAPMSRASRR